MKKIALGLSIAALGVAGVVYAQADRPHGPDTNGDGMVTRAEMTAKASEMFAKMDVNNDGKIDGADREARMSAMFDKLDADHNGQISRSEFINGHMAMHAGGPGMGMGARGEGMGHGGMGMGMHHGGMMHMMARMADTNNDGAITRDEFMAAANKHFDEADANHDGSISKAEREAAHAAMRERMEKMHEGMQGMNAGDHDMH